MTKMTLTASELKRVVSDAINTSLSTRDNPRIDSYNGNPNHDVLRWLNEFEFIANARGWDDATKLIKVQAYLTDVARDWYILKVQNAPTAIATWEVFTKLIKDDFLPVDHDDYLREELYNRVQGNYEPVHNYIIAKRMLCRRLNPTMLTAEVLHYISKGLKPEIKRMLRAFKPKTIEELIETSKEIERGYKESPLPEGNSYVNYSRTESQQNEAILKLNCRNK